jgi:large conductance mechanosensitive channel
MILSDVEMLEELQKIRKALEPPPAPPAPSGFLDEFKTFLSEYKVLGLAVAFILGIYSGKLVEALVVDLIMPILTIVIPDLSWTTFAIGPFLIGAFAGELLTFVIVAFVIFILVKVTAKFGIK